MKTGGSKKKPAPGRTDQPGKARKVRPTANRQELRKEFYEGIDQQSWDLRETVRRLRIMLGMTQLQFAEFTGVEKKVIMAFEQGRGNPTLNTLRKLLKGSGLRITIQRSTPLKG